MGAKISKSYISQFLSDKDKYVRWKYRLLLMYLKKIPLFYHWVDRANR